jgi:hypothetical protein
MSDSRSLPAISKADYEAIEAAVMETARGRWFLAEFARRNRTADTGQLLQAIGRLEQAVAAERHAPLLDRVRHDLVEMAGTIARAKTEIAALRGPDHAPAPLFTASEALDAILRTTERATSDILEAAENVQEAAWTLREQGADPALCDELDRHATGIYTACSFQDLTAQRTQKVLQTLRYLETRIEGLVRSWGDGAGATGPAAPEPAADGDADLSQTEIDGVITDELFEGPGPNQDPAHDEPEPPMGDPEPEAAAPGDEPAELTPMPDAAMAEPDADIGWEAPETLPPPLGADPAAFAPIDALPTLEKLKRFT